MASAAKSTILREMERRFGRVRKMDKSQSLYEIGDCVARVYFRYSKVHERNQAFYGLRKQDLQQLEGCPSLLCFLWDGQPQPMFVPYSEYEDVFHSVDPASDGQYKVQVFIQSEGSELYIANAGRFNVEAYMGWQQVEDLASLTRLPDVPPLTHSSVQTLLGSIGAKKGYDVWIPLNDRNRLDWSLAQSFQCCSSLPGEFHTVHGILGEVDVLWIHRGAGRLRALFEVEHSTPIYSALLRFNDIHLTSPNLGATFGIVSNDERRSSFVRQINRPTFKTSSLAEHCSFMEYVNVFCWHKRVATP